MVSHVGDDSFDIDQGHTGVTQFGVSIAGNYNEQTATAGRLPDMPITNPDGGLFGTESGDQIAEIDGEDCTLAPSTATWLGRRLELDSLVAAIPIGLRAPMPVTPRSSTT